VEFGLNGSEGNSPRANFRAGLALRRETANAATSLRVAYTRAENDSSLSESRLLADAKNDWQFASSPWAVFGVAGLEFDEFKEYDVRVNGAVGPAYRFIDGGATKLVGRLGFGGSREFGGSNTTFAPEILAGLDLDHKLAEGQRLTADVEMFPDLSAAGEFRVNAKAAWDAAVAKMVNLHFKLGVENRYDSTPEGAKRDDFDYFATLVWRF